ncbi:MAG TPA: helix-turn-helix domain-containing protein [Pedobacter sp.]|jgi:AraC-like DNA-binding protein
MNFSLFSVINLLGVVQSIFFSGFLLQLGRKAGKAHFILLGFLVCFALVQLNDVFEDSGVLYKYPHLISILPVLVFLLGPLIYFYVLALTRNNFWFSWVHLIHLLPMMILFTLLIPQYMLGAEEKRMLLTEKPGNGDIILACIAILQVAIYFIYALKIIYQHSVTIKNYFSQIERLSLNWLVGLIAALSVIWLIWLLNTLAPSSVLKYTEAVLFTVAVYWMGLKGIKQPDIFMKFQGQDSQPKEVKTDIPAKKYEKSGIAKNRIEAALDALDHCMKVKKLYRQNELTLAQLADNVGIPNHHLSQLLNERLNSNFYDYVNGYRVEEVKSELIKEETNRFTILAIALDAGFNSKASFNKAFKKHSGFSPSEFKARESELRLTSEKK